MRKFLSLILPLLLTVSALAAPCPDVQVYFSPKGGCTEAILKQIGQAKSNVLMQAFSFTSKPIAEAMVAAKKRGVAVEAILDKSVLKRGDTEANVLSNAGIRTLIDAKHNLAHNKIMILDGETVITGSFDFGITAEKSNAENLLVIKDKDIADKYSRNWHDHEKHSEPYETRLEK